METSSCPICAGTGEVAHGFAVDRYVTRFRHRAEAHRITLHDGDGLLVADSWTVVGLKEKTVRNLLSEKALHGFRIDTPDGVRVAIRLHTFAEYFARAHKGIP